MKKIISFALALVLLLCASVNIASAATITAEDKLIEIQKMNGFVPGKTSTPANNCFQFISNVCENLYGETYYYERLHDNFIAEHDSGKFFTVNTLIVNNYTLSATEAQSIKDFFVSNGRAGDVVHYGGYSGGSSHTFMIQHIDDEKMQIFHSNYGFANYTSAQCHIDTILWANFLKTPTKSDYDANNNCISVNSIFYNKMKNNGLGISINRFTDYDTLYLTAASTVQPQLPQEQIVPDKVTGLITTKISKDSVSIQWDAAANAQNYYVSVKNNTKNTNFGKYVETTSTSLNNLTDKNEYTISVVAISSTNTKGEVSDPITVVAKDSGPKVNNVVLKSRTKTSFAVEWDAVEGAESYYVLVKNVTKNSEFSKEVDTNSTTLNNFTPGNTYSVKVKAFVNGSYGIYSDVVKDATKPNAPKIKSVWSPSSKTVSLNWNKVSESASGYMIAVSTDKKFKSNVKKVYVSGRKNVSKQIKGLKKGKTYYVKVRSYKAVGSRKVYSSYSSASKIKCR